MDVIGQLQIIKDEEDEAFETRAFRIVSYSESEGVSDIRIEVDYRGRTFMFRFEPEVLMAGIARSLSNPEE